MDKKCYFRELWLNTELIFCDNPKAYGKILYAFCGGNQSDASLSFRRHAHGLLAKRLMHMVHFSGNTSGVTKSSSDWLNYTGFPGDVCVVFFNVPPGNKDAVAPNSLTNEESRCVYKCDGERLSE